MIPNQTYFDKIDSNEKAYWLGFISADGCVTGNGKLLQINLKKSDESHLEKLKFALNANDNIYPMKGYASRLSFYCPRLNSSLMKYGINEAKSLTLVPLVLSTIELQRNYWRGFVDGDGSICQVKKKIKGTNGYKFIWNVSLNGTLSVVSEFQNFILTHLKVCKGDIRPHSRIWKVKWAGDKACKTIVSYLYDDCDNIVLDRKQVLAKKLENQPRYHKGNPKPIFYD